jgi:hypothetical protein
MSDTLKIGDRVRVTPQSRVKGYEPGDNGNVVHGPKTLPDCTGPYYLVAMERDRWSRRVPFDADEIEADVRLEDGVLAEDITPMSVTLNPGDRVRLTSANRLPGYHPGDTGSILGVVPNPIGGTNPSYTVAMDKNGPSAEPALFAEDEIEPDV